MTKYQRLLNSNEALRKRETVLKAEIERLKAEGAACRRAREGLAKHYHETKAEIARLKEESVSRADGLIAKWEKAHGGKMCFGTVWRDELAGVLRR